MKRILGTILSLSVIIAPAQAGSKADAGTAGAAFLKLEAGARPAAMGDAFTAVSGDPNSVFRNPAGLAGVRKSVFAFTYAMYLEGTSGQWAAFVRPSPVGVFALGVQCLSYGSMREINETGVEGESFAPQDLLGVFSYAISVQGLSLGFNVKDISTKVTDAARATALDAGLRYGFFDDRFAVAAAFQNYGAKLRYAGTEDPLPSVVRAGIYWKPDYDWALTADYVAPGYNDPYWCAGAENAHVLGESFAIAERVGYTARTKDLSGLQGISVGLGMTAGPVVLDYALVPLGDLGFTHRLSLSISF